MVPMSAAETAKPRAPGESKYCARNPGAALDIAPMSYPNRNPLRDPAMTVNARRGFIKAAESHKTHYYHNQLQTI